MNLLIMLFFASQQDKRIQLKVRNLAVRALLPDIAGTLPEVWKVPYIFVAIKSNLTSSYV